MSIIYLNLTNGLKKLKEHPNARFIRIQSSHCESHDWNNMLMQLDSDFLFNLAIGREVLIIDGSKRGKSRALRVGVPVIEYVLTRLWLGRKFTDCSNWKDTRISPEYFDIIYKNITKKVRIKLKYFKKFAKKDLNINIETEWFETKHDGDYEYFTKIVKE